MFQTKLPAITSATGIYSNNTLSDGNTYQAWTSFDDDLAAPWWQTATSVAIYDSTNVVTVDGTTYTGHNAYNFRDLESTNASNFIIKKLELFFTYGDFEFIVVGTNTDPSTGHNNFNEITRSGGKMADSQNQPVDELLNYFSVHPLKKFTLSFPEHGTYYRYVGILCISAPVRYGTTVTEPNLRVAEIRFYYNEMPASGGVQRLNLFSDSFGLSSGGQQKRGRMGYDTDHFLLYGDVKLRLKSARITMEDDNDVEVDAYAVVSHFEGVNVTTPLDHTSSSVTLVTQPNSSFQLHVVKGGLQVDPSNSNRLETTVAGTVIQLVQRATHRLNIRLQCYESTANEFDAGIVNPKYYDDSGYTASSQTHSAVPDVSANTFDEDTGFIALAFVEDQVSGSVTKRKFKVKKNNGFLSSDGHSQFIYNDTANHDYAAISVEDREMGSIDFIYAPTRQLNVGFNGGQNWSAGCTLMRPDSHGGVPITLHFPTVGQLPVISTY